MTTEQTTTRTSTGLELLPPIPEEEWEGIRAEAEQYRADRKALAAIGDQLIEERGDIFAGMYLGQLYTADTGPGLMDLLRSKGVNPGCVVIRFLTRSPLFHAHYA
jgi:hypothetical protein